MRYHHEPDKYYISTKGIIYECNHPVYSRCTLYLIGNYGLAVIQQRFNPETKSTYWTEIDPWLTDELYFQTGFWTYFKENASKPTDGLYPTVPIRKIMWALRMKPIKRERWETTFDRRFA